MFAGDAPLVIRSAKGHSVGGLTCKSEGHCRYHVELAVRTALSTSPFAWRYLGELVVCTKPHLVANSRKESALHWGPLSAIARSGMPWMAKSSSSA